MLQTHTRQLAKLLAWLKKEGGGGACPLRGGGDDNIFPDIKPDTQASEAAQILGSCVLYNNYASASLTAECCHGN
jgi:hypothetical protein